MEECMLKIVLAITAALAATSANAAVTVYSEEGAFQTALGARSTEDFSNLTLVTGLTFVSSAGNISGGRFNDVVSLAGSNTTSTTFSFASGTKGFGGSFSLSPGGFGQGLAFFINGTDEVTGIDELDGFYGFVSGTPFTSVRITGAFLLEGIQETYTLDNLQFGASVVPEPMTWAMMILGLGAVGVSMRYRRRSTTTSFA